ncbi:hypothetical protein CWE13_09520 [Aliidiomarina shirensis]|uniref:Uncharacterized protein n=1 Tax=Aliidiomarina shirensis TaxID=1048642 RepID=A0A432WQR8_9GAMM|nr:hypothetical protein [Aliidiomarina shirensis]RUO36101.1 hypothetical protein CWE13_09520 [Aliidiomarina shirensis]
MEYFVEWLSLTSNLFTIVASGIAIYLFVAKRKTISSLVDVLFNYTYQLTLSEVKEKIERLNEYNAKDPEQCEKIINIFNEIIGQIRGNDNLKTIFAEMLGELESLVADKRRLTEPKKRAAVSELRERLRHLNVKSIDNLVGENE